MDCVFWLGIFIGAFLSFITSLIASYYQGAIFSFIGKSREAWDLKNTAKRQIAEKRANYFRANPSAATAYLGFIFFILTLTTMVGLNFGLWGLIILRTQSSDASQCVGTLFGYELDRCIGLGYATFLLSFALTVFDIVFFYRSALLIRRVIRAGDSVD